jgi:hypothetical protein
MLDVESQQSQAGDHREEAQLAHMRVLIRGWREVLLYQSFGDIEQVREGRGAGVHDEERVERNGLQHHGRLFSTERTHGVTQDGEDERTSSHK